jgi:hypothetical protein
MDADQRYKDWVERIRRVEQETTNLYWNRKLFRAVARMFDTNPALQGNGHLWTWLAGTFGRDAVMAVRRELDGQAGVLNLYHLLHEMEEQAHILTRARYHNFFQAMPWFPAAKIDAEFERFGGPPGPGVPDDHVAPQSIASDRQRLEADTAQVVEYAQRLVAHRTPVGKLDLKLKQIDDAVHAVFNS